MQGFPWWSLEHLSQQGKLAQTKWIVENIGAHLSNQTWLITEKQSDAQQLSIFRRKYLVKQFHQEDTFERNNKHRLDIDRYIAEQGLGPKVQFVSEDEKVVIYEYLWKPLLQEVSDNELCIQRVAQALARTHQLRPKLSKVTLRSQLEQYCAELAKYKPQDAARMLEDITSYRVLFERCEQQPQVFCHNDMSMDHIYVTPELKIIDWEYAGYNHPGFDIAMAVAINDFYDDEIDCLINEYNLHAAYTFTRDELPDWLRVVALVNRIWFKLQEAVAGHATAAVGAD